MSLPEKEKISIVIPAYNAARHISRTIESVLTQTHKNWELIVVDDASSDNTNDIVSEFTKIDERVKILRLESNHGCPSRPRNIGVKSAKGRWIAFLDSDDIWHPEKLEIQIAAMLENNSLFSCTQMRNFKNEEIIKFGRPEKIKTSKIALTKQRIKGSIPTSSVLIDRNTALKHPFNESHSYKAVEDYDCWLRVIEECGHVLKIDFPLVHYRISEGQLSGSKLYMLKRVFMVHRNRPDTGVALAAFFTATHLTGALYNRIFKKGI